MESCEQKIIDYMRKNWPSEVKEEWRVRDTQYGEILQKILEDFTRGKTRGRSLFRICGQSGSGKTSQLLPAVEAWFGEKGAEPVLVAARLFVPYHPYAKEIECEYGRENLRRMTDEVSTILMFLTLKSLIKQGYDIILDVTLLDPLVEGVLLRLLESEQYEMRLTMVAVAKKISDRLIERRSGRVVAKQTAEEFWRATSLALDFLVSERPNLRVIVWNIWEENPVFDGRIADGAVETIKKNWAIEDGKMVEDLETLRKSKIRYMKGWQ